MIQLIALFFFFFYKFFFAISWIIRVIVIDQTLKSQGRFSGSDIACNKEDERIFKKTKNIGHRNKVRDLLKLIESNAEFIEKKRQSVSFFESL